MVRRLLCLLLVDSRLQLEELEVSSVAGKIIGAEPRVVVQIAEEMKNHGSYYRNLEIGLFPGVSFVLGTGLPEGQWVITSLILHAKADLRHDSWNKLLPKKGPKFEKVREHLLQMELPYGLTEEHLKKLRDTIISHKLAEFKCHGSMKSPQTNSPGFAPPSLNAPFPQSPSQIHSPHGHYSPGLQTNNRRGYGSR